MLARLSNGMAVVVEEDRAAQVAAFQVWVGAGSADERDGEHGIAHLHEHMLFKGTARRGPGEIARQIEAAGGEVNAWTSFDQTVYHVVIASRFAARGLDVLADAVTAAAFDAGELSREIEVVCEEIRRSEDSPRRKLSRNLFAAAYPGHPYGRPVLGTQESVRGFTRDGVLAFYRRWYRPDNCVLVAAGDVRADEVVAQAEQAFRFGEAAARPSPSRGAQGARPGPSARVVLDRVQEGYLSLAWPSPALAHPDVAALDALALVLGHGEASRLRRALQRDRLLASEVSAGAYTPADPGLFLVGLTLQPEKAAEAVREALRLVHRARAEEVTPEELDLACRLLESDSVYQRETAQGMARKLGFWQSSAAGLAGEAEYHARVAALTPAAVREAAERWLDPAQLVAAAVLPQGAALDEAGLSRLLAEAGQGVARPRAKGPPLPAAPRPPLRVVGRHVSGPLRRTELPSGAVLLAKEERAVPLVALRAVWPGGLRLETPATAGLTALLSRLAAKGTRRRGALELARAMEAMGGSLGGASGRNSFGLRAELLSRDLAAGLDLFLECIEEPAFDPGEVERERTLQRDELRARDDNPAGVAFQLFQQTLWREHPYRLDPLGSEASLAALDPATLARERSRLYPSGRPVLAVVGDVDPDEVAARLAGRWSAAREPLPRAPAVPEPLPERPRAALRTLEKAQAHLVLGFPGVRLTDPERFALEVLSQVLAGQGGRLFLELRDRQSLAYSVTAFSMEGLDPGYFAVYIGCGPDKLAQALAGIRGELDRLRDGAPSPEELDRARTHLIGAHAIGLQRNAARAAIHAFDECYGLGTLASERYPEQIAEVSADQVLAAARRFLDPAREVAALVAPPGAAPADFAAAAAQAGGGGAP